MDPKLVKQLKNILDSHFNFFDKELSLEKFSKDWQKWVQDDDFLRFMILKEYIGYSMTISDFGNIMGNSFKSGYFIRPYEATADFQKNVCSFIEKYPPTRI